MRAIRRKSILDRVLLEKEPVYLWVMVVEGMKWPAYSS